MDSGKAGVGVLRWSPNPAGRPPVKYRVYGSDEKGFSVSDEPYPVNVGEKDESGLDGSFPANFVTETEATEMVVIGVGLTTPNTNRAYYRVVAVDRNGTRSGPSDYVEAQRPFIHSAPESRTRVGASYRYQLRCIRSLGDLRARGNLRMAFWDTEDSRFELVRGPDWLAVDPATGVLSGRPDAVGTTQVIVAVTLERDTRELDPGALSWGQEKVVGTSRVEIGTARQQFLLHVAEQ
jgi:hypothetical protein